MSVIRVTANAKINLTLDVINKRSDGYHDLKSIMQSVSLPEFVTLTENDSGVITLECDKKGVPCDERNIAVKCANEFYGAADIPFTGLHINVRKNIPMQAGLAGGSADGAAVLFGLNVLYSKPLTESELLSLGLRVGADIPFCLTGGTCLAEGVGEKLTKLTPLPECFIVLVKPDIGVSTAQAYAAVDSAGMNAYPSTDEALLFAGDISKMSKKLHNDFEAALDMPSFRSVKEDILNCPGCLGACMSGSGSAFFGIFDSEEKAERCTSAMKKKYSFVQTVTPTTCGVFVDQQNKKA